MRDVHVLQHQILTEGWGRRQVPCDRRNTVRRYLEAPELVRPLALPRSRPVFLPGSRCFSTAPTPWEWVEFGSGGPSALPLRTAAPCADG